MNKKYPKNNPIKGFTLIEMVVVLAIIGVITAFSIPYFGGFTNRTKLDSACREWIAYANYARSQAVMEGVNYRLSCDLDRQIYQLTYETVSTNIPGQYISPGTIWGQPVSIDSSLKISSIQQYGNPPQESGIVDIVYTPRGTTTDIILVFHSNQEDERQIIVKGITGLANIQSSDTST